MHGKGGLGAMTYNSVSSYLIPLLNLSNDISTISLPRRRLLGSVLFLTHIPRHFTSRRLYIIFLSATSHDHIRSHDTRHVLLVPKKLQLHHIFTSSLSPLHPCSSHRMATYKGILLRDHDSVLTALSPGAVERASPRGIALHLWSDGEQPICITEPCKHIFKFSPHPGKARDSPCTEC
jgi:hypothetical protein